MTTTHDVAHRVASVSFNEMQQMAHAMAASCFFGFKTQEQALAVMLIAHANGQHPAIAAQDYDVIQNRPAKKPQAMLRDFIAGGGKVEWHESTDAVADATFSHPRGGSIRVRWDMQRAQQMGLASKDNYKKQPGVMLRWRCVAEGVRIIYPLATSGFLAPEELHDDESAPATTVIVQQKALPLPAFDDTRFAETLPEWRKLVESNPDAAASAIEKIKAKLQTKYTLTDSQIAQLNALNTTAEAA